MGGIKFDEVKKTWYEIAKNTRSDNDFSLDLDIHKRLLNYFHIGPYYYFTFNCAEAKMEYVSDSIKHILGLNCTADFTLEYLLNVMHPEDRPYFLDFEDKVTRFFNQLPPDKIMKYKVSYDYRIARPDGKYVRVLQQAVTIQSDENGAVIRVLNVHTDITNLKKTNGSTLSFIGLDGEPTFADVSVSKVTVAAHKSIFTKREKEVLQLIVQGKSSKQIAEELFISKLTVDVHRKSLLKKTDSSSTVDLAIKALQDKFF